MKIPEDWPDWKKRDYAQDQKDIRFLVTIAVILLILAIAYLVFSSMGAPA